MQTKFKPHMKALWELAGKIGTKGETNTQYADVYKRLSDALDVAEAVGLIENNESINEEII